MSNIDHFPAAESRIVQCMKTTELTPKQILSVPGTTCGAAIEEPYELYTGALRTEPHRDRKLFHGRGSWKRSPADDKRR